MFSLTFIIFDCKFTPPVEVLGSIIGLSSLVSVEFLQTPLDFVLSSYAFVHQEHLFLRPASKHIVINNGPTINAATYEVDKATMGGLSISRFNEREARAQYQNSTEHIEIDASLLPWYEFEKMEWPCPQVFVLLGSPPAKLARPVISFFCGMKHLIDLQLRWVGQKNRSFMILSTPTSSKFSEMFPALTSLTVSNPTPLDYCYAQLPSGLKRLFLPVTHPEYGIGLPPDDARAILRSIAAGPASLVTLHLRLRCFTPPEVIRGIALGLPKLQNLEIGTMYNIPDASQNAVPWDAYTDALSPLKHLRELRFAPKFKSNGRPGFLVRRKSIASYYLQMGFHLCKASLSRVWQVGGLFLKLTDQIHGTIG